jgi:hypothetical protein
MKALVDQYLSLDVRRWQRLGLLTPVRGRPVAWRNPAGVVVLTLMMDVSREAVTLRSSDGAGGPTWRWYEDVIPIERRYFGHQGHKRPWWRCPFYDRLVALLYGAMLGFRCRRCYRLAYPSQYQPWAVRALARAQRLRRRLSPLPGAPGAPLPGRPRGMHTLTYYRLGLTIGWLEAKALQAMWEASSRKWTAQHEGRGSLARIDVRRTG